MSENKRIEQIFSESYKGRNQVVFSGGVDDLFLITDKDNNPGLYPIEQALVECGKKRDYDLIITVNVKDMSLSFDGKGQDNPRLTPEELFRSLTSRVTEVPKGKKTLNFNLRPRRNEAAEPQSRDGAAGQPAEGEQRKPDESAQRAQAAAQKNAEGNTLELITRALNQSDKRVLVIFPYPEKMFLTLNNVNEDILKKMETITISWRNIVRKAHPDSRSILIVNPHRLQEFQELEHRVSCYDHISSVVQIGLPDREEMKAWLKDYYAPRNFIRGAEGRDCDRVVLTGKAQKDFNLQNFVGWVQSFFMGRKNCKLEDLLKAENVDAAETKEDILEELNGMVGLDEVKKEINDIVKNAESGKHASDMSYHMFFLGNPGTGKTVVANLIAKLFWAMELRTSRKTVSIAIQDIVGQYNEGEAIQRMKDKIAEAMGGVLFVDEAYLFAESEWGKKAFQVLLTEMENHRDNLTVIFAGYENRLQALKDINEGIDSRIPYKLHFQDYTKEQKLKIFRLSLENRNRKSETDIGLSADAEQKLLRILERTEGNGRGVRNVLDKVLLEVGKDEDSPSEILEKHIHDPHEIHHDKCEEILADIDREFIGMNGLKQQLRDFFHRVEFTMARNERLKLPNADRSNYRLRFTGPPGTGKTSIARHMGRFFHAMGVTETDECRECGATTLKGAYIGHAQQAVNRLFHENRGKVIFIDEIYSLYNPSAGQNDQYGREAIDTLVRNLTAEEYQDTVVIVAGYKREVDRFMEANPGLASRIPGEIQFPNYSADECVEIFRHAAARQNYNLKDEAPEDGADQDDSETASNMLKELFEILSRQDNFGNARTVNGVLGQAISNLANRIQRKDLSTLTDDDFKDILKEDIEPILNRARLAADLQR